MKLSEAIRLGAMLGPQCFGTFRAIDGKTCALGAAEEASGGNWYFLYGTHPSMFAACPVCGSEGSYLDYVTVTHLNDKHHWTRERIADWVESVEQAHDAQPVTAEAVTA